MKKARITAVLALLLTLMIAASLQADPLQNMQNALVFLQKARISGAVEVKTRNLARAKDMLAVIAYDRGGHRAAAITLTTQAMAMVNQYKLDKANQLIDMAIVKVKHAMLAIKQETAARKKQAVKK